jgi:photosynthetic reaction center cytochrome c subunit
MVVAVSKSLCKAAALAFLPLVFGVRIARPQGPPVPSRTAAQQFKNIQVLKDIPADQLIPTMQFIAGSLGVDCQFCHVENAMDKDEKEEKKTARKMMAMELALNKNHFNNEVEVTCYSCHRGSLSPVGTPVLPTEPPKTPFHERHDKIDATRLPSAAEILDDYLAAVGGAEALHKITTRRQKGTIDAMGEQYPVEIYSEAPEKRVSVSQPSFGESVTAYNGQVGWLASPRGSHPMSAAEAAAARIDAQLYFPARVRELYQEFKVQPGEIVDGHATYLLNAQGHDMPPLRLYFDQQSGLLLRLIRYAQTPLGRNPTQIDYSDYREIDGIKVPYKWMLARTNGTFTVSISSIQQNVPIDEKLFVMPPATPAPQH